MLTAQLLRQLIEFPGFDPRLDLFFHPLQDFGHDAVGHLHLGDFLEGFKQNHLADQCLQPQLQPVPAETMPTIWLKMSSMPPTPLMGRTRPCLE